MRAGESVYTRTFIIGILFFRLMPHFKMVKNTLWGRRRCTRRRKCCEWDSDWSATDMRQSHVITPSTSEAASSTMRRSGVVKEVEKMQVVKFKREMKLFRLLLTFPLSG